MLNKYEKEYPIKGINHIATLPYNQNRYEELFMYLMYHIYDYEQKLFDGEKVEELIRKYYSNGKLKSGVLQQTAKLFDLIYQMWGNPIKKIWYAQTGSEKRKLISTFFTIVEEDYARDCMFGEHFPTLLCKP